MLYFAYGSNLDATQMRLMCPEARYVTKARLEGFRLSFSLWSKVRRTPVVSLEPDPNEAVWGVVYELDEIDLHRLDLREGYDPVHRPANFRNRVTVEVVLVDDKVCAAETHVAANAIDGGDPSPEYVTYLLRLAAVRGLPEAYRAKLRAVRIAALAA